MNFSEKWGPTVDEAVKLALEDLGSTIEEVNVTVLEEPTRGFLGLGAKLALVRVEKKAEEKKPEERPVKAKEVKKQVTNTNNKETKKENKPQKKEKTEKKADNKSETIENKKKEEVKFDIPDEPIISKILEEDLTEIAEHPALAFLDDIVKNKMGLDVTVSMKGNKNVLYLDINGKDSGTIIGKRGQTLDAIQYLTSLVVNKDESDYIRVVVDAEGYRAKREKTLELLAVRLAGKVVKTKKSVRLEPMNPYERKVIHATLQKNPYVTTRSEGQDPYRRVVIELK